MTETNSGWLKSVFTGRVKTWLVAAGMVLLIVLGGVWWSDVQTTRAGREEDLLIALNDEDGRRVRELLEDGVDANARVATSDSSDSLWQRLLALLRKPSIGDEKRPRALLIAAAVGDKELFDLLVSHGAPIKERADRYRSLPAAAAQGGNVDILRILLDNGHDPDQSDEYWTPMQFAINAGDAKMVRLLIERGADVAMTVEFYDGQFNQRRGSLLAMAKLKPNREVIEVLKRAGARK